MIQVRPNDSPMTQKRDALPSIVQSARNRVWFGALWAMVCVLAILWVYQHSYHVPFVFDDHHALTDNPYLQSLWPIWEAMSAPQLSPLSGRPMVALSFAVNYQISGMNPWSYHAGNLLIHIVNALLLMAILVRLLDLPTVRGLFATQHDKGGSTSESAQNQSCSNLWAVHLAGAIALLWAVHPLISEAIVYTVQRTELMVSFFYLLTVYAALRAFATTRPMVWYSVSIGACALGMASKEVMVSAPLFVLLLDRALVAQSFGEALRRRKFYYLGLFAGWLVLGAILLTNPRGKVVGYSMQYTAENYLMTQMQVISFYLQAAIWPDGLAIFHDFSIPLSWQAVLRQTLVIVSLLLVTLLLLLGAGRWRNLRPWGLAGALFFLVLAPSSSIVPIATEPAAERRMYLPLIAIVTVVVLLVFILLRRLSQTMTQAVGLLLVLLFTSALGWATMQRVNDYQSNVSIWEATVREYPDSELLHNLLAMAYEMDGRDDLALAMLQRAIELDPRHPDPHYNLGRILFSQGDIVGAAQSLDRAVQRFPAHHEAWLWKARLALQTGDLANAAAWANKARTLYEEAPDVLVTQGLVAQAQGDLVGALKLFERATLVHRHGPEPLFQIGQTLELLNRPGDALVVYQQLLELYPRDPAGHYALGLLLLRAGELDQARNHFEQAVQARPQPVAPRIRLAWTLAVHPQSSPEQWRQALQMAEQAVRETAEQDPAALDAYAAALACVGQFDEAQQAQKRAMQLTEKMGHTAALTSMARRLTLYEQGQPYVQPPRDQP